MCYPADTCGTEAWTEECSSKATQAVYAKPEVSFALMNC